MRKKSLFMLLVLLLSIAASADEAKKSVLPKPWKLAGTVGVNVTGNGLVNWVSGGRSSVSGLAFARINLCFDTLTLRWETNLNVEYGGMWKDQQFDAFQETNDKIDFNTKIGYHMGEKVYLSAYMSLLSQFAPSHNYNNNRNPDAITAKFLAPGYVDIGFGIDYDPYKWLSLYFSPLTCRMTTVVVGKAFNEYTSNRYVKFVNDPKRNLDGATLDNFREYVKPEKLKPGECWGLEKVLKDKNNVWSYSDGTTAVQNRDYSSNVKADAGLMIRANAKYTYKQLTAGTMLELYTPYKINRRNVYYAAAEVGSGKRYYIGEKGKRLDEEAIRATYPILPNEVCGWEGYVDNNRRFGNFDVRWEVSLTYHMFRVINLTFFSDLRYTNGLKMGAKNNGETKENVEWGAEKVQWKTTWGIGVGYSF